VGNVSAMLQVALEMPMTDRTPHDMKASLSATRGEVADDVSGRIREGRVTRSLQGFDTLERSEADCQTDIAIALLQMRIQTVTRMDAALHQLDRGRYGVCAECDTPIAARRLRALPFAVHCRPCAERRESRRLIDGSR
jgi:DnaK suppressor protein